MTSYKHKVYDYYRSAFKGAADRNPVEFGATKVLPLLGRCISELPRDSQIVDLGCGAEEALVAFDKLGFTKSMESI